MADTISTGDSEALFNARLWPALLDAADGAAPVAPDHADFMRAEWDLYAAVAGGRKLPAFVVGQLGQSLDGRIATASGNSHYINGLEALRHLHRLRALVDAVIVGVGTVIADNPRLTVRHGLRRRSSAPGPARIVIDPNGRLPADARLLADDGVPVHVVRDRATKKLSRIATIRVPMRGGLFDPADIVAAVASLGYRRLLVEGGAATVSAFLAAGAIDRLHLCVAPIIIGSGKMGIGLPPIDRLDQALRPSMAIHRLGPDILYDCDLAARPRSAQPDDFVFDLAQG